MSRNIDRWVRAMRDDVTGLANRQQQPTDAEVRAAREIRRESTFRQIVADLRALNPDAELPASPVDGPSEQEIQQAEGLLRSVDPPPAPDALEKLLAELAEIREKQERLEALRAESEQRQREWAERQAQREAEHPPRPQLVKDDARERHTGGPLVGPGWAAVSPRQSISWAFQRMPRHRDPRPWWEWDT